jgi:hypothetical protein
MCKKTYLLNLIKYYLSCKLKIVDFIFHDFNYNIQVRHYIVDTNLTNKNFIQTLINII